MEDSERRNQEREEDKEVKDPIQPEKVWNFGTVLKSNDNFERGGRRRVSIEDEY